MVVVGRVGRAHGVRGEVAVDVRTDEPDARFAVGAALDTDPPDAGPLTVARTRPHGGRLLVTFEGIADRAAAERLRGVLLTAAVAEPGARPASDEYYDHQLVGLEVHDHHGTVVGRVVDVLHHPAHELLVVHRERGPAVLVPFVTDLVPTVDLEAGRLTVADRPGLLDPERMD